ncbi:MAG: hypothetical protein ACI8UO_000753 [Verrucomicrobiales bacterium]
MSFGYENRYRILFCRHRRPAGGDDEPALKMTAELKSEVTLRNPADIKVGFSIQNRSEEFVPIVMPSDGSEVGWREPYVFYKVEVKTVDGWKTIEARRIGRCVLYNADWAKDVVMLEPDAVQDISNGWIGGPGHRFEFKPGVYRIRGVYKYGGNDKGGMQLPTLKKPKSMRDVKLFQIVSNWIEVTITAPS